METSYAVKEPYPSPRVSCANEAYARVLMESYAGAASELSAATTYIYQSFLLGERYAEVGKAMKGGAIVEMHHLDMLGTCIESLGGDPVYGSYQRRRFVYWDSRFVNYASTLNRMLLDNIRAEQTAIAGYRRAMEQIDDEGICAMLERIILDEELHIRLFKKLLEKFC